MSIYVPYIRTTEGAIERNNHVAFALACLVRSLLARGGSRRMA